MSPAVLGFLKRIAASLWFVAICFFFVTGFCVTVLGWSDWLEYEILALKFSLLPFVLIFVYSVIKYILYGDSKKS